MNVYHITLIPKRIEWNIDLTIFWEQNDIFQKFCSWTVDSCASYILRSYK